jgi:phosphoglycolate phosphatase
MSQPEPQPVAPFAAFAPALVIFDKGGTLIDFRAMWCNWAIEIARQLETRFDSSLARQWLEEIKFDPHSGWIDPVGPLALLALADLRVFTVDLLVKPGLSRQVVEDTVTAIWHAPDPVTSARPLADLPTLFKSLRSRGMKIAIATMDERASTEAQLALLGVAALVDAVVCAGEGLAAKPAPDMVRAVCRMTDVTCSQAVVVGDSITDLQMGRNAGAGLVIGVLSGVSPAEVLAPRADLVLESVADLI